MKNLYHISSLFLLLFAVTNTYCQTITTIAGGGTSTAEGVPATSVSTSYPGNAVQAYDGRVLLFYLYYGAKYIDQTNLVWNFVGTGSYGFAGDGGPATSEMADLQQQQRSTVVHFCPEMAEAPFLLPTGVTLSFAK